MSLHHHDILNYVQSIPKFINKILIQRTKCYHIN